MRGNRLLAILVAALGLTLSTRSPAAAQPEVLSLQGDRFQVEATWQDFFGTPARARPSS